MMLNERAIKKPFVYIKNNRIDFQFQMTTVNSLNSECIVNFFNH